MRHASGAVECWVKDATGSHTFEGDSGGASFCLVSDGRDFAPSFAFHLSLGAGSRPLDREDSLSLVLTVTRSVLRSSVLRLPGRGLPEALLLCEVPAALKLPLCEARVPRESVGWSSLKLLFCVDVARVRDGPFIFSLLPLLRRSAWLL